MVARMSDLPWLVAAPDDFRARIKILETAEDPDATGFLRLANTAMNLGQLRRMGKAIERAAPLLRQSGLAPCKLGIIGSHTTDFIVQGLAATGIRHGLLIEPVAGDYGQMMQAVLDPGSVLAAASVDAVLISLDAPALNLAGFLLEADAARAAIEAAGKQVAALCRGIREQLRATVILQTIPVPIEPLFGSYDARVEGSPRAMIEAYNQLLAREIIEPGDVLVDVAFVAASYGLNRWHDVRSWQGAKVPFSTDAVPFYADHVCRVIAAAKGKARKCLVLDLDDTVWGGVIGDHGIDGIRISEGDPIGEAHRAIQKLALELSRRGIVLAVCSKNDEENARLPFRSHADMLLREENIAAFVANWDDKAINLRRIARALNIGLDSLVFLDDNPFERAIVRQELPEVAVPELDDDPSSFPALLMGGGYFEAIAFGADDRQRSGYYQANVQRESAAETVTNLDEFLASLDMTLTIGPFNNQGIVRIAQLINKSNQFNLTTHRYSEDQVAAMQADGAFFTVQARLVDRFGDNGMISVIILKKYEEAWECDTWLMSCRVLGRGVEAAILDYLVAAAREAGVGRLIGRYRPTAKNGMVKDHFDRLGFAKIDEDDDGATCWQLPIADYAAKGRFITLIEN